MSWKEEILQNRLQLITGGDAKRAAESRRLHPPGRHLEGTRGQIWGDSSLCMSPPRSLLTARL